MFQKQLFNLYKVLGNRFIYLLTSKPNLKNSQKREFIPFYGWFISLFNKKDLERVRLIGPDCACAEWLLLNGAAVRFKGYPNLLSDYRDLMALEETDAPLLKVEEIYAENASLSHFGFDHFIGCKHVKKITFILCFHLCDPALYHLDYVKDSLEYLEIRSCYNIQDKGLKALHSLGNLKILKLANLISVKNKDKCEADLRKALPLCNITFEK